MTDEAARPGQSRSSELPSDDGRSSVSTFSELLFRFVSTDVLGLLLLLLSSM